MRIRIIFDASKIAYRIRICAFVIHNHNFAFPVTVYRDKKINCVTTEKPKIYVLYSMLLGLLSISICKCHQSKHPQGIISNFNILYTQQRACTTTTCTIRKKCKSKQNQEVSWCKPKQVTAPWSLQNSLRWGFVENNSDINNLHRISLHKNLLDLPRVIAQEFVHIMYLEGYK